MLDDALMFGLIYNIKVAFLFNEAATLQEIFFWTHLKVTLFPIGMIPCIEITQQNSTLIWGYIAWTRFWHYQAPIFLWKSQDFFIIIWRDGRKKPEIFDQSCWFYHCLFTYIFFIFAIWNKRHWKNWLYESIVKEGLLLKLRTNFQ